MRTPLPFALLSALLAFPVAPAFSAEPATFAAVHRVGATSWVELARFESEPSPGPFVTLEDDGFFHAFRRTLRGARALGTPVRLVAADGTCDGTLGRPALLGLYYGDEGYGGGPVWLRAAPVRGCGGRTFTLAVLHPSSATALARRDDGGTSAPSVLAGQQARVALTTSAAWLAARADWAANYAGEPVTSADEAYVLGGTVFALADDHVEAECGTVLRARALVRRAADGTTTTLPFPGGDADEPVLFGDLDGDGTVELVLAPGGGGLRVVALPADAPARELWQNDGVPFFGCPC